MEVTHAHYLKPRLLNTPTLSPCFLQWTAIWTGYNLTCILESKTGACEDALACARYHWLSLVPEVLVVAKDVDFVEWLQRRKEAPGLLVRGNVQVPPWGHKLGESLPEPAAFRKNMEGISV